MALCESRVGRRLIQFRPTAKRDIRGGVAILDAGTGKSFLLTTVYSGRVGNPEG